MLRRNEETSEEDASVVEEDACYARLQFIHTLANAHTEYMEGSVGPTDVPKYVSSR